MTKFKEIEKAKYNETVKDMDPEDKEIYDLLKSFRDNFDNMANKLHVELFREEHDFVYDSGVDASERKKGNNPMSQEYIKTMDDKRVALGFNPLGKSGYPLECDDTLRYCEKLISKDIDFKYIKRG